MVLPSLMVLPGDRMPVCLEGFTVRRHLVLCAEAGAPDFSIITRAQIARINYSSYGGSLPKTGSSIRVSTAVCLQE